MYIASINMNPVKVKPKQAKLTARQQLMEEVKEMVKRWEERDEIEAIRFFNNTTTPTK